MYRIIILPLLFCASLLFSQNLVRNPGFENLQEDQQPEICTYIKYAKTFNRIVDNWNTFEDITPDITFWQDSIPEACPHPRPFNGSHMVGFINYHPGLDSGYGYDYREYLHGTLKVPMQVGETYRIAFWIQQSDSTAIHHLKQVLKGRYKAIEPVACNNMGIRFFEEQINPEENIRRYLQFDNVRPHQNVDEIVRTEPGEWRRITFTFYADRPYRYFLIGNFYSDERTLVDGENDMEEIDRFNYLQKAFYNKVKRIAYYYIDDVYVGHVDAPLPVVDMLQSLERGEDFTFQNVLFESGKAILLPDAFPELNALADYLKTYPEQSIEIAGHTDSVGAAASNLDLSQRRAQAVRQYLIDKGASADQMRAVGYGETQAVADNETKEGRRQNRRVECLLLD